MSELNDNLKIKSTKTVYVVWADEDTARGGRVSYPHQVCELEVTAQRLAESLSNSIKSFDVRKAVAVQLENTPFGMPSDTWYAPRIIDEPSGDDIAAQDILDRRDKAFQAAIDAGLSEDTINDLRATVTLGGRKQ